MAAANNNGSMSSNGNSSSIGGGFAGGKSSSGGSKGGNGNGGGSGNSTGTTSGSTTANGAMAAAMGAAKSPSSSTDSKNSQLAGGIMSGLKSATDSARSAKTGTSMSGIQSGIQNAVNSAFGTKSADATTGTRSPNQTPAQRSAYQSGYADNTNQGMTRTAFSAVPGVGSLVGEGIARTAQTSPSARNPETAAAYASGVTGSKDAGLSGVTRGIAQTVGGLALGPIGTALAGMITGGASYAMQRAANPSAFSDQQNQSYAGPVTGGAAPTAAGNGNDRSTMSAAMTPTDTTAADPYGYQAASDYTDARNSYQKMNLGRI